MAGQYRVVNRVILGVVRSPKKALADRPIAGYRHNRRRSSAFQVPEQEFQFVSKMKLVDQ